MNQQKNSVYLPHQAKCDSLVLTNPEPPPPSKPHPILSPPLALTPHIIHYTRSLISPSLAHGCAWTRPPTRWAGLMTPTPLRPVLHRRRMGAPQLKWLCSPIGFWSTPSYGLSPSVLQYPTRLVPFPGEPVLVHSPCHPGFWVTWWRSRVGVGSGSVVALGLYEGNRRPGRSASRRRLESLSRRKRKEKEAKSPYWIL